MDQAEYDLDIFFTNLSSEETFSDIWIKAFTWNIDKSYFLRSLGW